MTAFRMYQNTGYRSKYCAFRKTISSALTITGAGAGPGQLTSFSLSANAPGTIGGVTWTNNFVDSTNNIGDLASLRALFELYKIDEVRLRWRMGSLELTDGVTNPKLFITRISDLTPASGVPTAISYFDDKEAVTVHDFTAGSQFFEYVIKKPRIQAPTYTASTWVATTVGYSSVAPRWLDLSDASNTQHFGVAWFIPYVPVGQTINVDIEFAFTCKRHQ